MSDATKVRGYECDTDTGSVRITWSDDWDGVRIVQMYEGQYFRPDSSFNLTWLEFSALHRLMAKVMAEGYVAEPIEEDEDE